MTLKEIKEYFNELNMLKKRVNEIINSSFHKTRKINEYASIAPRIKQIEAVLSKYYSLFNVKANNLTKHIEKVLKEESTDFYIQAKHSVQNQQFGNEHSKEVCTIIIHNLSTTKSIKLYENETNENRSNDTNFIKGEYTINVCAILTKNLPYSSLIHKACWNAVLEKVLEENKTKFYANLSNKKLLIQKLKLLQEKGMSESEISALQTEINNIDNTKIDLITNTDFANIDDYKSK